MSYKTMDWAWNVKTRTMSHKAVLQGLASMADEHHRSHPSQEYLAEHLFCTSRTIRRLLADLEEDGLISRRYRWNASENHRSSDEYKLEVEPRLPGGTLEGLADDEVPDNMTGNGTLTGHPKGGNRTFEGGLPDMGVHRTVLNQKNKKLEPSSNNRGSRLGSDFVVTPQMREWAKIRAIAVDIDFQTELFRNHFEAAAGRAGVKLDWYKTWQNWILRASTFGKRPGPVPVMHPDYLGQLEKFKRAGVSEMEFRARRFEPGWLDSIG